MGKWQQMAFDRVGLHLRAVVSLRCSGSSLPGSSPTARITCAGAFRAVRQLSATPPPPTLHSPVASSTITKRLRSPITWISAAATLTALYAAYEIQYRRQLNRERVAGRPDLGGPFELFDASSGRTVRDTDLRGQWALLYFGFTKCPDICPQEMEKLTTVLTRLDAKGQQVLPVFVTIDPHRDTSARLKHYFEEMDYHPRFMALTGSPDAVKRACRAYRVYFSKPTADELKEGDYLIDHSIISYLIDPNGEFVEYFGKSLSVDETEMKMTKLIGDWETERYWRQTLPKPLANLVMGPPPPTKLPRQAALDNAIHSS